MEQDCHLMGACSPTRDLDKAQTLLMIHLMQPLKMPVSQSMFRE
jgi:hypothetical protein